ncbi:glutathione S-transferase 1-like [Musca vetustissima]|uniref:glutathione S-transferase 1-like n=1 Tax=Musca vetustissima TaxID=27455 RepID=UPI002AB60F8F|nr:glutathione S-transferase 1-like [Musca vetustissima]
MGKLILYGINPSPPVRACLLTLKALNLSYEYKIINILAKEQLSEDYMKKNPQHTVPTLDDDGHFIWDSHAIIAYLVGKYATGDALYPKDLLKRAVVDQRMYFEASVLFQRTLCNITFPMLFQNLTQIPRSKIDSIFDSYGFLESFLKGRKYMAGNHLTIADLSIVTSVTSLQIFAKIDRSKFPKLCDWLKTMQSLPYYEEANGVGLKELVKMLEAKNFTIVD